jgi:RNA polymerase sigma-70 factor (ECF subfamily)
MFRRTEESPTVTAPKAASAALIDYAACRDEDLAARARLGDGRAFRVLMQRFNQPLFRTAGSLVRDDAEAEDVLQEAYMRGYRALGSFRGEASLQTWLTRIVINEARRRLRKQRPVVELSAIEEAQNQGRVVNFPGAGEDPEREAARAEARRLLERAVDDLPEAFRLVFILREVQECSIEETAHALDIKPETVKTRLFRARRMLRERLDERLGEAMTGAFPFLGRRCERITAAVLARLGLAI